MKLMAVVLTFALPASQAQPAAPPADASLSSVAASSGSGASPLRASKAPALIFQSNPAKRSPRTAEEEESARELEAVRLAGGATAGVGAGLLSYAVVFEVAGPIGWAAALIFFGGIAAYLAHRKLREENDFAPAQARPPRAPPLEAAPSQGPRPPPPAAAPANPGPVVPSI